MNILASIEEEIARLQKVRAVLTGKPAKTTKPAKTAKKSKRKMSAAGRKAIAEAQKKRWAKKKASKVPF